MIENQKYNQEEEIDLLELIRTVWSGRKLILKIVIVFTLIGLFIAVFSAKQYTATTVMVPQTSGKSGVNLGGFAAMAGIDLSSGSSDGIPPNLYPKIINSVPFKMTMLQTPLKLEGVEGIVTFKDYLENHQKFNLLSSLKKYTIGLPGLIAKALKREQTGKDVDGELDSIIRISVDDYGKMKTLSNLITMNVNSKEGVAELSVSMSEPLPAAQMATRAQKLLQQAIIDFKVKKAKDELSFIEERYIEVEKDFLNKQRVLASFKDRNRGISTSMFATRLERLQADYNMSYSIYVQLAKKLETQKIQVKEETPVFTIIEPVSVPVEKSKPKRLIILAICFFLGIIIGVVIVLSRYWVRNIKL